jgi:hypothetical protein
MCGIPVINPCQKRKEKKRKEKTSKNPKIRYAE